MTATPETTIRENRGAEPLAGADIGPGEDRDHRNHDWYGDQRHLNPPQPSMSGGRSHDLSRGILGGATGAPSSERDDPEQARAVVSKHDANAGPSLWRPDRARS